MDEEDLLQIPDRMKWYESKFCADDMPDWYPGRFVSSKQVAPGLKSVVVEMEVGREKVPLRNAYKCVGQRAMVRVNSGVEAELTVSSPPFPQSLNKESLIKVRGDLFAGEIKKEKPEAVSILAEVELLVTKEDCPDLYVMDADDSVELGPFKGAGLDIKASALVAIYRFPTIVMFVSGKGIAHARALVRAPSDVANLSIGFRKDVRMYYKVTTTTSKSFFEAFDDDNTLVYNPETSGAIILTGGDVEEEKDAREACKEAEIIEVVSDIYEAELLVTHLDSSPTSFSRWVDKCKPKSDE